MGRLFLEYLDTNCSRVYTCKACLAGESGSPTCQSGLTRVIHLAAANELLSKSFHSRHGPAYLFNHAVNVTLGPEEERDMTTGRHVVCDLFCVSCGHLLGWRYLIAHEEREKYKEGKYILERTQLVDLEYSVAAELSAGGNMSTSHMSNTSSGTAGNTSSGGDGSPSPIFYSPLGGPNRVFRAYPGSNPETVLLLGGTSGFQTSISDIQL